LPGGGDVGYPNKLVNFLTDQFGGITPNCDVFQAMRNLSIAKSKECQAIQLTSGFCGCKPKCENHCDMCPGEIPPPEEYSNKELAPAYLNPLGFENVTFPVTCEVILSVQYQLQQDDPVCTLAQQRSYFCGCSPSVFGNTAPLIPAGKT
jgi:hypothetical protein